MLESGASRFWDCQIVLLRCLQRRRTLSGNCIPSNSEEAWCAIRPFYFHFQFQF